MAATPSNKTRKQPQDRKTAKPSFGKRNLHELVVPSGATIKVRRPGMEGLVKAGVLESFDTLTAIVSSETIPRAEGKPIKLGREKMLEIAKNPDKMSSMIEVMNDIVAYVVVEPKLEHEYFTDEDGKPILTDDGKRNLLPDEHRDENLYYVDYVEDDDKTFILNFALGGSADLQQFREATQEALGSVPDGEAAPDQAE